MTPEQDKIVERIQNLLAVAENDASTDGEKRNAMRMADALMRKHRLDRGDIKPKSDGTFDIEDVTFHRQSVCLYGTRRTDWEMQLARFISRGFIRTCLFYYNTSSHRVEPGGQDAPGRMYGATVTFYGPKDDVELACHLFRDMSVRIAHYGKEKFGGYARGEGASYCTGFVSGLKEANAQVEAEQDREKLTGATGAMILADRQLTKQVREGSRDWLTTSVGVKLHSGSRLTGASRDGRAYGAGVRDGRSTTMSKQRSGRLN